jgi:hypothetical protein
VTATPALLTTKQVATALGISVQRVNQLAIKRGLGWQPTGGARGVRLFTESDVAAIVAARRPPGRPKSRL